MTAVQEGPSAPRKSVRVACQAMKCRFEAVLCGGDRLRLGSIGEEALEEVRRAERRFNFYDPASALSRLNREGCRRAVPVDAELFDLLTLCRRVWEETQGAFDPTVSPLLEAWGWFRRRGRQPSKSELARALERVGFDKVRLLDGRRVRLACRGLTVNLGSVAKGWALDQAAEVLREHGIRRALLHGGTSTVVALEPPEESESWAVDIPDPRDESRSAARFALKDGSLSVSANHRNVLPRRDAEPIGHVLDPRTGYPVKDNLLAAVKSASAAESDAYSTAALVAGESVRDLDSVVDLFLLRTSAEGSDVEC